MESSQRPTQMHASYRLSWAAYLPVALAALIPVCIGIALCFWLAWLGALVILGAGMYAAIRILALRSLILYTDDHGVWVYRGLLPWSRGVTGVKWRDLEEAAYTTGFFSWLLKSYTIRVGHRFTKTSEIVLQHVARGQEAVEHINAQHRQVLAGQGQGAEAPVRE